MSSEPRTPGDKLLTPASIVCRHFDESKYLFVELFWDVRPVHLQVEVLVRDHPLDSLAKSVALSLRVVAHSVDLHVRWTCFRLLGFGRLLDDASMLRQTRDLVDAEFCVFLGFKLKLTLAVLWVHRCHFSLVVSALFGQEQLDQVLYLVFVSTHRQRGRCEYASEETLHAHLANKVLDIRRHSKRQVGLQLRSLRLNIHVHTQRIIRVRLDRHTEEIKLFKLLEILFFQP